MWELLGYLERAERVGHARQLPGYSVMDTTLPGGHYRELEFVPSCSLPRGNIVPTPPSTFPVLPRYQVVPGSKYRRILSSQLATDLGMASRADR